MQSGGSIKAQDLAFEAVAIALSNSQNTDSEYGVESNLKDDLPSHEQQHILEVLEHNNGHIMATDNGL